MIKTNNTSPLKNIDRRGLRKLANQVWQVYQKKQCELSLTFVSRLEIVEINKSYLKRSYETDVIAFNLGENPDGRVLADVYICPEVAAANAEDYACELSVELARLVVHGVLHVLGFDDHTETGREEMRQLEDQFLEQYVKEQHRGKE